MKKILIMIIGAVVCFGSAAQTDRDVDRKRKDLENLKEKVEVAKALIEKFESRTSGWPNAADEKKKAEEEAEREAKKEAENALNTYLAGFGCLTDMLSENKDQAKEVEVVIGNASTDSPRKKAYLLIFKMANSLENPYNKESNLDFIREAKDARKEILDQHLDEYDALVAHINDYEYYMYQLALLFVAADEDEEGKSAEELAEVEDASYLMKVPYTKRMLEEYIQCKKDKEAFPYIEELQQACPNAFNDLK